MTGSRFLGDFKRDKIKKFQYEEMGHKEPVRARENR